MNQAPRPPTDPEIPDFETLIRRPGRIRMRRWKRKPIAGSLRRLRPALAMMAEVQATIQRLHSMAQDWHDTVASTCYYFITSAMRYRMERLGIK